jgi:polysaccharide biosynthesis/export protein
MKVQGPLRIACALLWLALTALAAQEQTAPSTKPTTNPAPSANGPEYVIGVDDLLAINVWKEPELTKVLAVRPDGKITLPLVGELTAAGLTALQLQEQLTEKLKDYVASPEVTVSVQEVRSLKFNVIGEVLRPGSYPLTKSLTVLDGLAAAGGFKDFAKTGKIYVLRRQASGSPTRLPFNYKQVIKGKKNEQNIALQAGDTIVVP